MKQFYAIAAALLITGVIGLGIVAVGVSALVNHNTVALQSSPTDGASNVSGGSTQNSAATSAEVQQLRQQVSDAQTQLDQANLEIQQYQSLLMALQQRGVISIDQNGNILIPREHEGREN